MTLEEAIKVSGEILDGVQPTSITDRRDAIKLGIEALKRVEANRERRIVVVYKKLPGETEGEK